MDSYPSLLYFSDSTPLVIIAATYEGIRLLEVDGNHTSYSSPIETPTSASRVDLFYAKDEIVFQKYKNGNLDKYVMYIY